MDDAELRGAAEKVLRANREGAYTVPSRTLYPHQWSWDSAFHALGWRQLDPAAARAEIDSLLAAQWADGRIAHIAFNPAVAVDAYFPGPTFWRANGGDGRATSGIVQPPVHAGIVARLGAPDEWLAGVYPRLCAWHDYLLDRRVATGRRLVSIVHPWESGMDNSPMWDRPLAAVPTSGVEAYTRRDIDHASAADRPTGRDYDRYVALAEAYRHRGYTDALARGQFLVECPLFNSVLAWSEDALASVAARLGQQPSAHRARAEALTAALADDLWNPELGMFAGFDVRAGRPLAVPTIGGLAPLLTALPADLASQVVDTARDRFGLGGCGVQLPTVSPAAPLFDARRYWRGPAWSNTNWLAIQGLRRHGYVELAAALRECTLDLARGAGMHEYFHAIDGRGLGSAAFGWTAAATLDLLADTVEP